MTEGAPLVSERQQAKFATKMFVKLLWLMAKAHNSPNRRFDEGYAPYVPLY